MGQWQERFNERGSFRGAPFWVERHSRSGGRDLVKDKIVGRDGRFIQDTGARENSFRLSFFVAFSNIFDERDALIDALDAAGPGLLDHPWFGEIDVHVESWDESEESNSPEFARFDVSLVKAEAITSPTPDAATEEDTRQKADAVNVVADVQLGEAFSVDDQPGWAVESAIEGVNTAAAALDELRGLVPEIPEKAQEFSRAVQGLLNNAATLARQPFEMAAAITGAINQAAAIAQVAADVPLLYRSLAEFRIALPIGGVTATRLQETANLQGTEALVRVGAAAGGARATALIDYASSSDALGALNEWSGRITEVEPLADADTFIALKNLKAAIVADLTQRAAKLPQVRELTLQRPTPSLVLANKLYGHNDVEAASDDLVARNNAENANFLPDGVPIETLEVV
jgi:prophage DNA circulation protein